MRKANILTTILKYIEYFDVIGDIKELDRLIREGQKAITQNFMGFFGEEVKEKRINSILDNLTQ